MIDAAEGRNPILSEMIDCYSIVSDIYTMFRPEALRRNVDLKLDIDECDWPESFLSDRFRIKKIVMSLVSNAIKFSHEKDSVVLRMSKNTDSQDEVIINFIVKDTGGGITPDNIKEIFKPFFKVNPSYNNADLSNSGPGVGLAIAKKYSDEINGQINCKSVVDKGSIFVFSVPLKQPLINDAELNDHLNN